MNQPKKRSEKTAYTIRIAVGAYLLYTAYSIIKDWNQVKPGQELVLGAAIVVFVIIGILLCLTATLSLQRIKRDEGDMEEADSQYLMEHEVSDQNSSNIDNDIPKADQVEGDQAKGEQAEVDQTEGDQAKADQTKEHIGK